MGTMVIGRPWYPSDLDYIQVQVDGNQLVLERLQPAGKDSFTYLYIHKDYLDALMVKILAAANGEET